MENTCTGDVTLFRSCTLSNCDQIAKQMAIRLMATAGTWLLKDQNDAARMHNTEDIHNIVSVNLDDDPRSSPNPPVARHLREIVPLVDFLGVKIVLFLLCRACSAATVRAGPDRLGRWAGKRESSTPWSMAVMRRRTR